jgi:hypothetical protein
MNDLVEFGYFLLRGSIEAATAPGLSARRRARSAAVSFMGDLQ